MIELQKEIVEWADEVFPERTLTNALIKLVIEEVPELWRDLRDRGELSPLELADVAILLLDVAHLADIDLEAAVKAKMEINKARSWRQKDGVMVHEPDDIDTSGRGMDNYGSLE